LDRLFFGLIRLGFARQVKGCPGSRGPVLAAAGGRKAPRASVPECPGWLEEEARAEWSRVVPELSDAGLLSRCDRAVLAAYCQSWAELVACTAVLVDEGRFITESIQNAKGVIIGDRIKAHPALASQRDALGRIKAYLAELGLSPAARARMRLEGEGEGDALKELMARG
jgi:P27 family predicted phage terminase small subunit